MLSKFYVASLLVNDSVHTTGRIPVWFTSNAALKATVIPATNVITSVWLRKRRSAWKEKPLIETPNTEEVEELSEQTTESTGLDASLATAASPAEDRTRKQEEYKPLPEASEADEGLEGTSGGAEAGDNLADVAAQVEKLGIEGEENKTLPEISTSQSGEAQSKHYLKRSLHIKYSRM